MIVGSLLPISLLLILVSVALLVAGVLGGYDVLIVGSIVATVLAAIILIIGVRLSAAVADDDDVDVDDGIAVPGSTYPARAPDRRPPGRRSPSRPPPSRQPPSRQPPSRQPPGRQQPAHSAWVTGGPDNASSDAMSVRSRVLVEEPASRGSIPSQGTAEHHDPYEAGSVGTEPYDSVPAVEAVPAVENVPAVEDVDEDPADEPAAQVVSPSNSTRIALLTADVIVVDGRPRYHLSDCAHLVGRVGEPLPVGEAVELGFTPCSLCEPDNALLAEAPRV